MTRRDRPRARLTRRGRIVSSTAVVGAVALALVALQGDPADVEGPGLTTGAALLVPSPSPSPSPSGPPWTPAIPVEVAGVLAPVPGPVVSAPVVVVADLTDRSQRDLAVWLAARLQAAVVPGDLAPTVEGPSPRPSPATAAVPPGNEVIIAVGDVSVPDGPGTRRVELPASGGAPADPAVGPLQLRRALRLATATEPPRAVDLAPVEDLLDAAVPAEPTGAVLLARSGATTIAEVATAHAVGHRVVLTDAHDPRADPGLAAALAGGTAGAVEDTRVGLLGSGWDDLDVADWSWQLDVVRHGLELPGGGQLVFPGRMIVALYGHPDGPALGVLGEQPLAETLVRAAEQAAVYDDLVDVPVVPAFEIIATVASAAPGPRGDHSRRTTIEQLRPYVAAARDAGMFVVLDLQPGRTDFLSQAKEYEELLREPHVGLALDPEWRLGPGDRHLVRIGSVGAAEVNAVITWLADLTRREALPQKLLVLHQFKHSMITDRASLDTSRDELALLLHVDGQGGQPAKLATYASMLRDLPPEVWIGWKNFHDEDRPMRSEAETVTLDPLPVLVTYQ